MSGFIVALAIAVVCIAWLWLRTHCIHDWYTCHSCGTYGKTGPLPGESHAYNGLGQGGYRYERHCLKCDRAEYQRCRMVPTYTWEHIDLDAYKKKS